MYTRQPKSPGSPNPCLAAVIAVVFIAAGPVPATAQWQTVDFDLTKSDAQAYATDIPPAAFTPEGLRLPVKPGVEYTLTSRQMFSDEFDFDLQIEVPERSEKGAVYIDEILVNQERRRKAVGTYRNVSLRPGSDSGTIRYYKDGRPMRGRVDNHETDASSTTGYGQGFMEWLRMHKAPQAKVWFLQRLRGEPYSWPAVADYPKTTYFQEDCDSFQVGFVVRSPAGPEGASGTVRIKAMRIAGAAVRPRDRQRRTFLFDFGPVNQELEDEFTPVNQYSTYTPAKGYGWVIPDPEKLVLDESLVPELDDEAIAAHGLPPVPRDDEGWYQSFLRKAYWLELNDKRLFYSTSHGFDYVEFFQKWLDLKTPLDRDFVGMARPYHFGMDHRYQKDVEERRGSLYIDDDLSGEFLVDLPNGRYNLILGVGYSASLFGGPSGAFNVEVQGRVRKQGLGPHWRRASQNPIRDVNVTDGRMRIRLFCDVRKAMDPYSNHNLGLGWMLNYLLVLPADEPELMNQWEWKIIKRRGEVIRRVTFVPGGPARTRNEGNFISLNGKPFYFHKVMNNYHPGSTEHYPYYCLATVLSLKHPIRDSAHFFRPDWEKLSYSDDYPWQSIDEMNMTYTWGFRGTLHHDGILSFVPHAAAGEGSPTLDSRGRSNRYNIQPPLNSALGKEIQKEAYTMMSNQLRLHPANAGHFVYEELWHPDDAGFEDQSLLQFREWLRRKYGSVERLNEEWGRNYKSFDEIAQPEPYKKEFWDFTPEWVDFRKFRGWAQREMVRSACDLLRGLEPEHFSWGAKGDFGTQSWYTGEFVDAFGWYDPYVAASVARYFGRAAVSFGYLFECEHAYLDGRRQFDHKPGPRTYRGRDEAQQNYNHLISSVFKGTKGFFSEWYEDGMCHAFHRTAYLKEEAPKYRIRHWTGQLPFYEPAAFEGPPVNMDRNVLRASAANQMLLRLAPLWLPAKPLTPRVLLPTTEASFFLRFFGEPPYADFETVGMRVLRSANLCADFMALPAVEDLSRYRLIVMTDTAQAISRRDAARIKQFVRDGGKLILLDAAGFSDDVRPRRYRPGPGEVFPLEEFAELGGYRLAADNAWHMSLGKTTVRFAACDVSPGTADGTVLGDYDLQYYYEPLRGSRVFLKGKLPKTGKEVALGLVNPAGNVVVASVPPKEAKEEVVRLLARWFRPVLDRWQPDDRVTIAGIDDAWDMYAGCLEGEGYTLAAVCNLSAQEQRKVSLRLGTLPKGEYAVIDVTSPRPELMKKSDGGLRLRPDPAAWNMKIERWMSGDEIARQGIACEVQPLQARVFLLRPKADRVWVSLWPPSLAAFAELPITIAYGTGPGEKDAAGSLRAALASLAVKADVAAAGRIKRKRVRHEVRIDPMKANRGYREDMSTWYLMDVFDNELIDCPNNLILVGSADTNELVKLLAKEGTFAYDKMPEKIGAAYPDPGRGVIGMVEAVNSAIYDLRSESRDAVVAGGADAAGTRLAVEELVRLLRRHVPRTSQQGK
ncbi:MAG: beta-galactosidase [Thermoguttaceae bacterium]